MATDTVAGTMAGAPPPIRQWFLRRVQIWILVVGGCALPLTLITWPSLPPGGRVGEVSAIVAWVVIVVVWDERRRPHWSSQVPDTLRTGAVLFGVAQGVAAAVLSALWFVVLYAPAIWVAMRLRLRVFDASLLYGAFVMTFACGAQIVVCAWGLGRLVERLRPSLVQLLARARRGSSRRA